MRASCVTNNVEQVATAEPPLYLDFAASTPPAEEVVEAMLPWLRQAHANPHAQHWHGRRAGEAVDAAREAVAHLIGAEPESIVFTSGATEANNLALKGLLSTVGPRRRLWLADTEHKSLREPARYLASQGVRVDALPVSITGRVEPTDLLAALANSRVTPGLVAISQGNNEFGTLQPLPTLGRIAADHGHLVHVDASQSAGRVPVAVADLCCDLLCLSSHKIYGPGGIGALYIAPKHQSALTPQMHGGGQEGGARSGTVAPFLAVGFGTAAKLAQRRLAYDAFYLQQLARTFIGTLANTGANFQWIGDPEERLPGHVSLRFPGVAADDLLAVLGPMLSASTGSACVAGELRASAVLRALGLTEQAASEVIRFTFGRSNHPDDAQRIAVAVAAGATRVAERNRW
ncbi:MAG: cysteine desulfurase family protein [Lysobacterales bacterium]